MSCETTIANLEKSNFAEILTDRCYGFFDWFCKDSYLPTKAKNLVAKLKTILKCTTKFDKNKTYVFFKNNCPCCGPLYDDFRICDIEDGSVLYTVVPKSGHSGKAEVWGIDNDFEKPIVKGTWTDVKQFFAA